MITKSLKLASIIKKIKKSKTLIISLLINTFFLVGLIVACVVYRQTIANALISKIFAHASSVSSYHLSAQLLPYNTELELDYVEDNSKYKQANIKWNYKEQPDSLDFIYNQDNIFIKFDSRQLLDYILLFYDSNNLNKISSSQTKQIQETILNHPIMTGETYLHLDEAILGNLGPSTNQEEDILESNRLINNQIIHSFHLNGYPVISKIDKQYFLKIPLYIEYNKLNSIIYPSIRSHLVKNQETLKSIVDQTKVYVYLGLNGYISKINIEMAPLTQEQAELIFIDKYATSFADLSKQMVKSATENPLSITLNFSDYNKPIEIIEPLNIMSAQDAANSLVTSTYSSPKPYASKYTINNSYIHKKVSSDIFKDFTMVNNMLYRYYNEHGSYPSTLDPLSNAYFPGTVPGNVQTGQGFAYSTFENNQGYYLCPAKGDSREYCYKKFKINEIN